MEKIVELKNVSKAYKIGEKEFKALDNVNLAINKGELVVILGPSGAGKSTLLNLIGGMDSPSNGSILVDGVDISEYSETKLSEYRAENVGFIFQFYNILPTLTVLENVDIVRDIVKNYSDSKQELTISPLPSTTLNLINIEINDYLTIIDTPGLIDEGSITNYVDNELLKVITPKKEIKTKTYQLRRGQSIIIGDLVRIDYVDGEKNSFTLYISNDIKTKRIISSRHDDLKNLAKRTYQLPFNQDIVVKGLGFIKVVNRGVVDIYLNQRVETFLRDNLI